MEYTNSQVRDLIDEHIHSERDRQIMKRRMIDGVCFEPLAEEFDLSTVQVKRIVRRERTRILKMIQT
jgi:Mor family transcriptional regulator